MEDMHGKFSFFFLFFFLEAVSILVFLDLSLILYSPGRFFVQAELKMIIAYLVLNYDVKPLAKRPANKWIGSAVVPPDKETVWVKRKTPEA